MLKPILSRIREAVACYHQRVQTTDSLNSFRPGTSRRFSGVLRVLAPLGISFYMLAAGVPMLGPSASHHASNAPTAVTRAASGDAVYAATLSPKQAALAARRAQGRTSSRSASWMTTVNRIIYAAAKRHGVDAALVRAVVRAESEFNNWSHSHTGAMGLMQLQPETARNLGVSDPWDPAQNINGGTRFLAWLLKEFHGNTRLAVAAYNAGPGAVKRYGGVPPYTETQHYVRKVLAYRANGG